LIDCEESKKIETELIKLFKQKYKKHSHNEYFEGNRDDMMDDIYDMIKKMKKEERIKYLKKQIEIEMALEKKMKETEIEMALEKKMKETEKEWEWEWPHENPTLLDQKLILDSGPIVGEALLATGTNTASTESAEKAQNNDKSIASPLPPDRILLQRELERVRVAYAVSRDRDERMSLLKLRQHFEDEILKHQGFIESKAPENISNQSPIERVVLKDEVYNYLKENYSKNERYRVKLENMALKDEDYRNYLQRNIEKVNK